MIAAVSAVLASEFAIIGMRQYGVIHRLPDPPGFDSNFVITSRAAYPLGIPDAALAVLGSGMLIALATARGARRSPWLDLALGAGIAVGGTGAVIYVGQMIRLRRACAYCIVGATGFLALAPLAARGVLRAWRRVRGAGRARASPCTRRSPRTW
ncbi:hypothetical protein BH11MYX3_BH11MYX3_38570 [soil metagenome]